jgi:hypothetical protein
MLSTLLIKKLLVRVGLATLTLLILSILSFSPVVKAANEFYALAVEGYGDPSEYPYECSETRTIYCWDTLDGVFEIFDVDWSWSYTDYDYTPHSGQFVDDDCHTWGYDDDSNLGLDHADVGFWCTHGSATCVDEIPLHFSSILPGMKTSGGSCQVLAEGRYGLHDLELGSGGANGDMDILMADSCHFLQDCVWWTGAISNVMQTAGNMTVILGYHGGVHDSSTHSNDIVDAVDASRYNGIGDNWIDYTNHIWSGWGNDDCAVVALSCDTAQQCEDILLYGGFEDRADPGDHSHSGYYYVEDCHPHLGDPL